MKRYWIIAGILAVISGALFRGAAVTHNPFFDMAATIGLVLVGATAIGGVVRWQGTQGRKQLESALLSLGDGFIVTDWMPAKGAAPDYLVVAPAGAMAIVLDDMNDTVSDERAEPRLRSAQVRCQNAAQWVKEHAELAPDVPVVPILVLTRRKAEGIAAEGIAILNPEHVSGHLKQYEAPVRLERPDQVRLTRKLRAAHTSL